MDMKEWLDIFSDNLVELLEDRKMTQYELASDSGISTGSISAYINKQSIPGPKALINIAYSLDVSLDELMDFGSRIE